jgi:hypothetical protein
MYFQHLCADNDTNGNPRRLYVLVDECNQRIAAWDEGYEGWQCVPGLFRNAAYNAERINVPVKLYKELRRESITNWAHDVPGYASLRDLV